MLICALILCGAGGIFSSQFDALSLKNELRRQEAATMGLKADNAALKDTLTKNADSIAKMKQEVSDHVKELDVIAAVEQGIPAQEKALEQAKEQWQKQFDSMQTCIRSGREAMMKKDIPELKVKGGNILANCKLVFGKNGNISWQHSTGIARLPSSQLPPDIADQVRLDALPSLSILPDPAMPVAASEPAPAPATPAAQPESVASVATTLEAEKANEAKLKAQMLAINQLKLKIVQLTSQLDTHMRTYYDHTQRANYAQMMGRISSQAGFAAKARDNASKVQARINEANFELNRLQTEVAYSQ